MSFFLKKRDSNRYNYWSFLCVYVALLFKIYNIIWTKSYGLTIGITVEIIIIYYALLLYIDLCWSSLIICYLLSLIKKFDD